jgi:hypothetical protein
MNINWINVLISFLVGLWRVGFWLLVFLTIKKIIERNQTKWKENKPIE